MPTEFNQKNPYLYSAAGTKLRKQLFENGSIIKIVDYQGDFQYENGVLQFIAQPEGYIYKDATGYRYVYQYKDHLGNNRLSFMRNAGTVAIVKETNYYPFGLTHKGYNNITTSLGSAGAKKYQYNGKLERSGNPAFAGELQDDYGLDWYDYGARFYDASLGRWFVADQLSEWHFDFANYNYCFNNPINYIDPIGMDTTVRTTVDPHDPKKRIPLYDLPEVEIKPKKDPDSNKEPDEGRGGYHFVIDTDVGVNNDSRKGDGETRNISLLMDNLGPSNTRSWLIYWLFNLFQYTNSNGNNDVYKKISDKEIIEKHTGIGEKTDAHGQPIGKYKNWIKNNSGGVIFFHDPSGDSVLLFSTDGDSILLVPFQKLKGHVVQRQKIDLY